MRPCSIPVPGSVHSEPSIPNGGSKTPLWRSEVSSGMPPGPQGLTEDARWLRDASLGKSVGLYRLRGDLGSGNFSRVKMAIHHPTNERVAIKILEKTKLDEKTRRMLAREIATMEGICHPNVIKLFEVVETYARIHLVTEYAPGGELFDKISEHGRLKEEDAKPLYAQILSGVKYMHSLGFVHRDIKAENVFYAGPGLVKLGDFGFSTRLTEGPDQMLKTFCGSPPYAAPELFRDESYLGPYVDIWALGVLLYLVVTGTMPFRARTVLGLRTLILEGKFSIPDHVTLPCRYLICGALRQIPLERATIDEMLASEWFKDVSYPTQEAAPPRYLLIPTTDPSQQVPPIEREARTRLDRLGIDSAMLSAHAAKGPRSSVIGTYRIVMHKVMRPAKNQAPPPPSNPVAGTMAKKGKSKLCSIL